MARNYTKCKVKKNMKMIASATHRLHLHELKQHIPLLHEEYLQPLVQMKQAKLQLFTGSQPKKM
jgi:hypothetical protein